MLHKNGFVVSLQAPQVPMLSVQQNLGRFTGRLSNENPTNRFPAWIKLICKCRDHMRGVVVRLSSGNSGCQHLLFALALQNPQQCFFQQCEYHSLTTAQESIPEDPRLLQAISWFSHVFRPIPDSFLEGQQVRAVSEEQILVYQHVSWDVTNTYVTDIAPFSWAQFKGSLPEVVDAKPKIAEEMRPERKRKHDSSSSALALEHPWLFDGVPPLPKNVPGNTPKTRQVRMIDEEIDNMDALDRAWEEFQEQQAAWKEEHAATGCEHFATSLRGGRWTHAFRGSSVDTIVAQPITAEGRAFIHHFSLNRMFTCAIKKYGREMASLLCEVWCARMQYAFSQWLDDPASVHVAQAALEDLSLDACQVSKIQKWPEDSPAKKRLRDILTMESRVFEDRAA